MILSDNETKLDMLNNRAISKTVVNLIKESKESPISIGIHGDWGAGKSSILEMVIEEFESFDETELEECGTKKFKVKCIRFNSWRYQGLEDSKTSLMSAIVSELAKDKKLLESTKDIFKKLWKNINWLGAAKGVGKLAFSLAAGNAPLAILNSVWEKLKENTTSEEKIKNSIDVIGNYIEDAKVFEDTSSNTEFSEFQQNFGELLKAAKIDKLVVLIDDLDRCLPEVAIEILEAMRLFMFTNQTAFVIAADEAMIKYAVKNHFPDVIDITEHNIGYDFSDKYLEKLIQVPFRIPTLGEVESSIYIMLLLIGSKLSAEENEYKVLIETAIEKLKRPWDIKSFSITEIQNILGDKYGQVAEEVSIAIQISPILAVHTSGNPRKIKRFINMLILRDKIAEARGFGEAIKLSVLAKMMLAEYYWNDFYKKLAQSLNSDGICDQMRVLILSKKTISANERLGNLEENGDDINHLVENQINEDTDWLDNDDMMSWVMMPPLLGEDDLRPYYFASKEKEDYFFEKTSNDKLRELITILMAKEMVIAGHKKEIESLSTDEATRLFNIIIEKIMSQGDFKNKPAGIDGVRALVEVKKELQDNLANFVASLQVDKVGLWVCSGWDKCLPRGCSGRNILEGYYKKLEKDGNTQVKNAFKATKKGD